MARVSTRTPYQPRPRTITIPEAATILSSFTFLQFSRLQPSNSSLSAQRVDRVPTAERPSAEGRDRLRNRPGSTRPSILSGSKVSERANRAYFYYRRRTRTPHSVRCAEMTQPKLTQPAPSPKTHSPMAQAAAGMYMTYHYQVHTYIAQWCEQAKNDLVERLHRTDGFGAVRQHELGRPELGTKDAVDRGVYQRRGTPPRPHGS